MVKLKKKEQIITEALNEKADASKNEEKAEIVEVLGSKKGNVTVFCGIPMGLRLPIPSGEVVLKGIPMSHIVSANKGEGFLPAGKYGETIVSEDQWDEIMAKYNKYDFIVNGVVFAEKSVEAGRAEAKEKSKKKLGFEQADPKKAKTKKVETEE